MGPLNVGMPKMAYVCLALAALGVWKIVDVLIWLFHHIHFTWG